MAHYDEQPDLEDPDIATGDVSTCHPLIVGVGAGGSRRESLRLLLSRLEHDDRIALILCISPLEMIDDGLLLEEVASATSLRAMLVADDTAILPGHVYLAPSSMLVTIDDGMLRGRLSSEFHKASGRIDHLLLSLATDSKERAVAIILAGTGDDGLLGTHAIRQGGGLTIAEAAPEATQATAHHILPADRIGACVTDHARRLGTQSRRRRGDLEARMAELQSSNQGLLAANSRLKARVREFETSNADLRKQIESVKIASRGESEAHFRMMAQAVPDMMFTFRADGYCEYLNSRFYEYTGMSPPSGLGDGWMRAVHPDDVPGNLEGWQQAVSSGRHLEVACRLRATDGSYRWFRIRAEPVRDGQGAIGYWFGSAADIHEYRMANDRQRMLVAELQHRVKNILAVVRSIFSRSIEVQGATEAAADHFRGRLDALARTQNVLARTPEGGIDLEEMIHNELSCHGAVNGDQVIIAGPTVRLRQKAAETLGLAVHELATNAAKYGALATGSGRIGVTWRLRESATGPRLSWKWAETGVTLIDPAPSRIGFGRELLEQGLPYQLGASTALEFASGGINCVIELPLSERIAVLSDHEPGWSTP